MVECVSVSRLQHLSALDQGTHALRVGSRDNVTASDDADKSATDSR